HALQDARLRRLVLHAAEHVPFWKRRFARYGVRPTEVRSIGDLAALPPLEERDLVDFGDDLLEGGEPSPAWTSVRSITNPLRAVRLDVTARRERVADELRHIQWTGLDWRAPRAVLVGRNERGDSLEGPGGRLRAALRSGVWLHPGHAGEDQVRRFVADAGRAGAQLLCGPPSALERVADAIETGAAAAGTAPFRPRAVQSWGECLGDERRARLETAIGAPVYDVYRTAELGEIAQQCDARDGLHVTMERVLIEIVQGDAPVADGRDGEILVTALDNLAMPLFRYRVGDVGCRIPAGETCSCGRTADRILLTDGRASTLVTSPGRQRVHPDWFEWLFEAIPGVLDWRVTQDAPTELVLSYVPGVAWRDDAEPWIREAIAGLDPEFTVRIERAESLSARADGRRERVSSRVPLAWNGGAG
ncbi:MAG: hypothetical protein ABI960_06205, partial [Candidatus Eisenbacteria bacterium]